ncbi:hypothetical protein FB451DRAFT_1491593 [Mycena latifolia]|nr:hypothetical protein FB451DRAFT_1491593 [Mycena latifolia]
MSSLSPQSAPPTVPARDEVAEQVIKSMLYHQLLERHLVPPKELGIPLKHLYPSDWNWHFQRAYRQKYGPDADLEAWKRENFDLGHFSYLEDLRGCNQEIDATSKVLLEAEGLLVGLAIEQLDGGFEAAWTALEVERKQDLGVDGLVRAAFKVREESRFDCPEMSLFGLIDDGEYNLINLLKAIIAHDPTGNLRVKSLYLFSHPEVEREYGYIHKPNIPEGLRAFGYLRIIQRNLYIVQALIGVLEAYAGKPAPKVSAAEERAAKEGTACYSCGAVSTEDGVTLRKCSGCKLVSYCSSECQKKDWRDHKKLCRSQPVKFDPALVTPAPEAPPEFIGCLAPEPGFLRSPALWRQIWYLSKKDSYTRDYHRQTVRAPSASRTSTVRPPAFPVHTTFDEPLAIHADRLIFLIARRRAMASGDRGAVCKMYDVLDGLQRAGVINLTQAQIRGQLEREYRVSLDHAEGCHGPPPTPMEVLEEMRFAHQRDQLVEGQTEEEDDGTMEEAGDSDEEDGPGDSDVTNEWESEEDTNSESEEEGTTDGSGDSEEWETEDDSYESSEGDSADGHSIARGA